LRLVRRFRENFGRSQSRRANSRCSEIRGWRSRLADVESIGKADLDSLAKELLAPKRASRAIILPK
jgi:hypothetical protein